MRGAADVMPEGTAALEFLLTRLMRGAAETGSSPVARYSNFYSRASCEARRGKAWKACMTEYFYSRASCEARQQWSVRDHTDKTFLLTRLMRGAATMECSRSYR